MTSAELAILTLIGERPRHGYEIEQVIEERGMREWTELGFSSIYYVLKRLEQRGLIEGQLEEAARGPARKVHHILPAGRDALRLGVLDALSVPRRRYPPLQLGLANLPSISRDDALSALGHYRGALAARLMHLRTRRKNQLPRPDHVEAMFDYSLAMVQAELEWVRRFMRQLRARA